MRRRSSRCPTMRRDSGRRRHTRGVEQPADSLRPMRFVVCGEALIDLVAEGDPESTFVSTWRALSAGGPMNTAIALARLGADADFLGRVSTDQFGRQIASHLAASQVGESVLVRTDDPTSLAVVSLDDEGRATYTFHFDGTANVRWDAAELPRLDAETWLHVASLALIVEPSASVLLAWADQHPGPMSLDLNVRPTVLPDPVEYWERIEPWLSVLGRHRGLMKASDEDIAFLARGAGLTGEPADIAADWAASHQMSWAVTTLGPDGAVASAPGGETFRAPGHRIDVADTIGAGDTFMGALLQSVGDGVPMAEALQRATAASALVCTRSGAQPPTAAELTAWISA